ncbi:MAG: diguanylate cyclase [Solirubrobacteraceae bacterium]
MRSLRPNWSRGAAVFAPLAAATLLAWATLPIGDRVVWPEYLVATGVAVASGLVVWLSRSHPGRMGMLAGALLYLIASGLLRDAGGGFRSGASLLGLIPVFYIALMHRSRQVLAAVTVAMAAFFVVPVAVIGAPDYPSSQYRAALLAVLVCGTVALAVQTLVARVEEQAAEARAHGDMLQEVAGMARALLDSPQVRDDLCLAAQRICRASVAVLFEPVAGCLQRTAGAGSAVPAGHLVADPGGTIDEVFRSGAARSVDDDVAAGARDVEPWRQAGSPGSVLYEPLLHGGGVVGVLAVAWPERIDPRSSRRNVAALIAHEAAGAIARADALVHLADEAQTDPLTGLANRRAWDAALSRAFATSTPITLAMLDLDNFKQFNDTFGHLRGDRLLAATAAAWREQLRGGDLLARLGGEEFGLLICDVSAETAVEVVERLRRCVPEGRTASAGVAARLPGESPELLLGRADEALYEAKALGRDRTCVSGM